MGLADRKQIDELQEEVRSLIQAKQVLAEENNRLFEELKIALNISNKDATQQRMCLQDELKDLNGNLSKQFTILQNTGDSIYKLNNEFFSSQKSEHQKTIKNLDAIEQLISQKVISLQNDILTNRSVHSEGIQNVKNVFLESNESGMEKIELETELLSKQIKHNNESLLKTLELIKKLDENSNALLSQIDKYHNRELENLHNIRQIANTTYDKTVKLEKIESAQKEINELIQGLLKISKLLLVTSLTEELENKI